MFGFSLGGLGSLERRTLDHPGSQGRLSATFRLPSSSDSNTYSPSELLSLLCPGVSSHCFHERLTVEGCHSFYSRLFVTPKVTGGWPSPQPFCSVVPFSNGDIPVSPPISPPQVLDDFHRPSGRLPPGSSRVAESEVFGWSRSRSRHPKSTRTRSRNF